MLDETRSVRTSVPYAGVSDVPPVSNPLAQTLLSRWRLIVALAALGAVAAYAVSTIIPPSFVASSELFVDPRSVQVLKSDLTVRQEDSQTENSFVESQARIVTSESVLSRVVAEQHLADDPEFNGAARGLIASLLGLAGSPPATTDEETRARNALTTLYDRTSVHRPERTFIIDISVMSRDAAKAATLANAVAQSYLDAQTEALSESARRANAALTNRLDELRERLRVSEAKAEDFRRKNGLVGTRTQLVSEQQLTDATTQLAQTRSRVIQAKSRLDQTRNLQATAAHNGSLPEAIASPTIGILRGQQSEALRKLADARSTYGDRYPGVRDLQAQVADINRVVAAELGRIAQAAQADYDRAVASETAQKQVVETLTGESSSAGTALVQLAGLQREADINRNLLNAFMSRARETSELERVDSTNARIVTSAQPPRNRSFPPRGSVLAILGLLAGAGLGAALALLLAMRQDSDDEFDRRLDPRRIKSAA
ncbi:GumC family protein [Lichenihabitans psoromatis]|uniref:GumC family protein n=1 Tax=Lichenihabitans psoromatis TaxID=2528642 RepID=UPI0010362E30|nr:GumC family protein [Lichenihabitans psoromatis]